MWGWPHCRYCTPFLMLSVRLISFMVSVWFQKTHQFFHRWEWMILHLLACGSNICTKGSTYIKASKVEHTNNKGKHTIFIHMYYKNFFLNSSSEKCKVSHTKLNTLSIVLITEDCKAEKSHILVNTVHTIKITSTAWQKLCLPPTAGMTKSQLNTQLVTSMMNCRDNTN